MRRGNKRRAIIVVLVCIVALLLLAGTYFLLVRPSLNGLVVLGRNQGFTLGVNQAVVSLLQQLSTCQQPVPVSFGNYTLNVVALECVK